MRLRDQLDETEVLEQEARYWVTRLVSGDATTLDAEALKGWCAQSPAHRAAFIAATRLWKDLGPAGRDLLSQGDLPAWSPPNVTRRMFLGAGGALAATAAGYAIVKPPLDLWPSLNELAADYRTATGEQRHITVAGDVSVRMNTQTSIAVSSPADATDRITLIAGEASFTTAPEMRKPLIVLAGNGRAIARKAQFDVRNVGATVCVTCFDGEVRVEQAGRTVSIGPKQEVRYDADNMGAAVAIDPGETAAWQDGFLVFRFTPLSDAVAEINRYRPGKVVLMNQALGPNLVNGRFRIQKIDDVLVWIERAFGATARSLPGGIVLLS
jgi:transmembrane sensor